MLACVSPQYAQYFSPLRGPETVQRLSNSPVPSAWLSGAIGAAGPALSAAVDRLARLDDRLAAAPPAVRRGWLAHLLLEEAAASAALDSIAVDADELRLQTVGALAADEERAVEGVDRVALAAGTLRLLRAVTARHPRQLFTANRLAAAARLRLKGRPGEIAAGLLQERLPPSLIEVPDPAAARAALARALTPEAMARWHDLPPLIAAGDFLGQWSASGCADAVGGAVGRALVPQLLGRLGATAGPVLFPALGFRGHLGRYRPDRLPADESAMIAWLEACQRAAEVGLALHGQLSTAHQRLHAALKPARSTGRGGLVADLLTEIPAVTGAILAQRSGLSAAATRSLLSRAVAAGALHLLTRRDAFRVYGPLA
ncbi:Protein of unknown function [Azospirillum oryzae]|uniref:HTH DNA binding domain-containing protein n=1 Tax=Azospirillum oryzae TaxID=286727 RepID=A0A1X7G4W4_9PROT|nr:Protein of unknown function [Azospirillum oryzae]